MGAGLPAVDADAVLSGGETVYGSASSLYVATAALRRGTSSRTTTIHRFDITSRSGPLRGSGFVAGHAAQPVLALRGQGHLRAARRAVGRDSESPSPRSRAAAAPRAGGKVDGLGRASGSTPCASSATRGYVVTFRQTDPLYTLDLADPADPRVRAS